ncbi:hypothetical protein HMPREF0972_01298 [Actinomyces sp. oral taxon 848 str. F0332]|nr:hypothetical protein HMPREF0972_01298 [Actinomyces sp. oral taxon 848 str. F0332]
MPAPTPTSAPTGGPNQPESRGIGRRRGRTRTKSATASRPPSASSAGRFDCPRLPESVGGHRDARLDTKRNRGYN